MDHYPDIVDFIGTTWAGVVMSSLMALEWWIIHGMTLEVDLHSREPRNRAG